MTTRWPRVQVLPPRLPEGYGTAGRRLRHSRVQEVEDGLPVSSSATTFLSRGHLTGNHYRARLRSQGHSQGPAVRETLVRDIMSAPVLFVTPNTTLSECMLLITSRQIRHLPVVKGDRGLPLAN
jgi:CBS domain-containing protein